MKPVMMAKPAEEEGCIGITIAEIDSCLKDLVGEISTNLQLPFQGKGLRTPEYHLNALDADWSQIEERSYETLWYQNTGHSSATEENKAITGATFVAELEHDEHITEFRPRCDALYSPKSEDNAEDSFPMLSSRSNTLERDNSPRNSESCQYNVEITPSTNIATQTNMVERDSSLELMGSNSNVTILPSMVATKLQETREQKLRPRCDAYGPKLEDNAEDSFPMLSSRSNTLERDNSTVRYSESNQNKVATKQETREQELPRCDAFSPTRLRFNQDNVVREDSFQIHSTRLNVVGRHNSPVCSESNHDNVEIPPLSNIAIAQTKMIGKESGPRVFEDNEKNDKIRSPQIASRRNVTERDDSSQWSQSNQNNMESSSLTVLTKPQSGKREKPRPRSELIRTCTSSPNHTDLKYADCREKRKTELWGRNSKVLIFNTSRDRERYRRKSK